MPGRTQFTFTFTNADPDEPVTFDTDADVFAIETGGQQQPRFVLDSNHSVAVWSDAAVLTASTVDGTGARLVATATRENPSVTNSDGVAPTNSPHGNAASVPVPTTGDAGKVVTVKGDETGYELDTPGGSTSFNGADAYSRGGFAAGLSDGDLLDFSGGDNTTLLDFTVPTSPTFLTDGIYSILVLAAPDNGAHAGKSQKLQLRVDLPAGTVNVYDTTPLDYVPHSGPVGWVALTWYIEAGTALTVTVFHDIGSATDWDFNVYVQRVA